MRECAGSKAASLWAHWAHFSVMPDLARGVLVYWFPHPTFLSLSVHFFKWQVFYPTLNKIKYILYIGEDKIGQHFYKKNRLEENGTVDACMTSLTESAQGWSLAPFFFFFAFCFKSLEIKQLNIERLNSNECSPMYQYCFTNWKWVLQSRAEHPASIHGTWEHLLSHVSNIAFLPSTAWDPLILCVWRNPTWQSGACTLGIPVLSAFPSSIPGLGPLLVPLCPVLKQNK